jgi:hypothetical protein
MRNLLAPLTIAVVLLSVACPEPGPVDDDVTTGDDDVNSDDDDATSDDDDATSDDDATTPDPDDQDGDGYTPDDGDCNDTEPTVFPGATEVLCDQVDSDCDGWGEGVAAVMDGMEFVSLTSAAAALTQGATLAICPGTHTEQVYIQSDSECTLTSFSGNSEDTILDGLDAHTVIYIGFRSSVTVSHLTIQNGQGEAWISGDYAGGGIMSFGTRTVVEDCTFLDNDVDADGGGGGGIAFHATAGTDPAVVQITGCHIEGSDVDYVGGAVYANSWVELTVEITNTTFHDNHSLGDGGGALWLDGDPVHVTIADSTFTGNTTNYTGGAISLVAWDTFDLTNSTFSENTSGYEGGAIYLDPHFLLAGNLTTATIRDSTFENNDAGGSGGALTSISYTGDTTEICLDTVVFDGNHSAISGGSMDLGFVGGFDVTLFNTDFQYNSSTSSGGAVHFDPDAPSTFTMEGGSMVSNTAGTSTSALKTSPPEQEGYHEVYLYDVLFEDNDGQNGGRGAIYVMDHVNLTLESCSVARNAGSGLYMFESADATLYSIDTDWGVYPYDNDPHDIQIVEAFYYDDFGASETFTCTGTLGCF